MHHLLTVSIDDADRDILSATLWNLGALGIEDLGLDLRAAFTDRSTAERAAAALDVSPKIEEVEDHAGLDDWREHANWVQAGPFVICPPWIDPPEGSDTIFIDPGYSFGSGSHPTTRMTLAAMVEFVRPSMTVLDVGCGSGVLSIAAARLGAEVTAVDNDPEAITATLANARLNNCADTIRASLGSAEDIETEFDLVMVNMTIDIQEAIASHVGSRLGDEGTLVVSGILTGHQVLRLGNAHPNLDLIGQATEAEWAAVTMKAPRSKQ